MNILEIYSIFNTHPLICTDSRKTIANSIFFALKGDNFNGNKYALQAIKNGCAYAIVDDKDYCQHKNIIIVKNVLVTLQELARHHRKKLKIPIIAITGTNGKTTCKELINNVLNTEVETYATQGNLNNHIGVPLSILNIKEDTKIGIIEMGANHKNEIDFLCNIAQPTHAIITNIGLAHLEGFNSLEGVLKTKNELYQYVKDNKGYVFVNNNDKLLIKLAEKIEHTTYGKDGKIEGELVDTDPFINIKYKDIVIRSKLIGIYQFENIMLSVCVGNYFNISLKNIKKGIEKYIPSNNRSQIIETEKNKIILDAYNANPSSMNAMLHSFSKQEYRNKLCILGDMLELGDYAQSEHKKIVELCRHLSLECFFIGTEFNLITKNAFINTHEFLEYLKNKNLSNKTILIKGSRSIKLEDLVPFL